MILPTFIERLGGNAFTVGIIIGIYSLFQFFFSPILGRLSDKYGRRPVLLFSTMINVLAYSVIFLSHSIPMLIVGRILGGIGTANLSVVQAYVADTSQAHERTKRMALIGSIFSLGFIFGPFVGGLAAAKININAPFLITAIFSLLNVVLIALVLPESNKTKQAHIKIEILNIKAIKEVLRPKNMSFLIFVFFLANFSLALLIGIMPLFSHQKFGWNEEHIGYFFMAIGVASFITQAFILRWLLKKWHEIWLIKAGMIIFGIANIGTGIALNEPFLILSGALSAVGFSLVSANLQALISLESRPEQQGTVMGVAQSFAAFARVLGPIIGGA